MAFLERLGFELQIGGDGEEDLEDQNPHFISTISIAKIQSLPAKKKQESWHPLNRKQLA